MSHLDDFYRDRTLNFAHQGASGYAPGNTLSAFRLAADMGAHGIELDVHLSADGEVVVIHNGTVDATTNGTGQVSQLTLAQLRSLDAGSWFDSEFEGERIPTLQEVFEAVGRRLLVNVEIKFELGDHPLEQQAKVVRLIEENQMVERVIISSFSATNLRRVREINPTIPLAFLYSGEETTWLPRVMSGLPVPFDALNPYYDLVDAYYMEEVRRRGPRVNVWTVNHAGDMRRMLDLGVDSIITNYPDVLNDILTG